MRRRATALGAPCIALAVAPASADAAVDLQSVQRSIATAQVGPVKLNLPVRVGSPGNNEGIPRSSAKPAQGGQTTNGSIGAVQCQCDRGDGARSRAQPRQERRALGSHECAEADR